jgi:uncharacterized coiled-coil DUF342 family protein
VLIVTDELEKEINQLKRKLSCQKRINEDYREKFSSVSRRIGEADRLLKQICRGHDASTRAGYLARLALKTLGDF